MRPQSLEALGIMKPLADKPNSLIVKPQDSLNVALFSIPDTLCTHTLQVDSSCNIE